MRPDAVSTCACSSHIQEYKKQDNADDSSSKDPSCNANHTKSISDNVETLDDVDAHAVGKHQEREKKPSRLDVNCSVVNHLLPLGSERVTEHGKRTANKSKGSDVCDLNRGAPITLAASSCTGITQHETRMGYLGLSSCELGGAPCSSCKMACICGLWRGEMEGKKKGGGREKVVAGRCFFFILPLQHQPTCHMPPISWLSFCGYVFVFFLFPLQTTSPTPRHFLEPVRSRRVVCFTLLTLIDSSACFCALLVRPFRSPCFSSTIPLNSSPWRARRRR